MTIDYEINETNTFRKSKENISFEYWNDETIEKGKCWDISDGNFTKLEDYIRDSSLKDDLERAIKRTGLGHRTGLRGCELAGGVCWTAPILFDRLSLSRMDYLEFSYNRLAQIAPRLLTHYGIPSDKCFLRLGSFYETEYQDGSFDFVLLSQALHHAEKVDLLMKEVRRILRDDGRVIIIGETKPRIRTMVKSFFLSVYDYFIKKNKERIMLLREYGCIDYDTLMGDRLYLQSGYKRLFKDTGFFYEKVATSERRLAYVLWKNEMIRPQGDAP